jgi:hypothetical protein
MPLKLDERPSREIEAREVTEGEVCNDAEMEVTMDGKRYCVVKESIPNDEE